MGNLSSGIETHASATYVLMKLFHGAVVVDGGGRVVRHETVIGSEQFVTK